MAGSLLVVLLFAASSASLAQKKKKSSPRNAQPTLADRVAKAKADLITAAGEYKASLQSLLKLQEADVKSAKETVEKRKELLAQNIIAKKELEESERAVSAAEAHVAETKRQLGEADSLIVGIEGEGADSCQQKGDRNECADCSRDTGFGE